MPTYEVVVSVRKEVRFPSIEALSPGSAESIAEAYVRDGDDAGEVVSTEVEEAVATPLEDFVEANYELPFAEAA